MEKVLVYDLNGNEVTDPEDSIRFATAITFESTWPKGNLTASFRVKRTDIFADWVVKESYGVIIWDGATILWQGRIDTLPKDIQGAEEYITVPCTGWYCVLEERDVQKRWIDTKAIDALRWPDGLETSLQTTWVQSKREKIIQVFVGTGDVYRTSDEQYRELYELPPAGYVRRISFSYIIRSGENFWLVVYNSDNTGTSILNDPSGFPLPGFEWYTVSDRLAATGSATVTFQLGNTRSFELKWVIAVSDTYDQNDYAHVSSLRVEVTYEPGHRNFTNPTYTIGQLVEEVILLCNQKGAQLSTDFAQLGDPGLILDPFVVEEPTYADQVIQKLASYGDSQLRTWGLCVWDKSDTSDGKPRVVFEARDVSDYEYEISLSAAELAAFSYEKISDGLYNSVTVQYIDEKNNVRYRRATDNAALKDQTSITNEYQRDHFIKLGPGDATRADYVGARKIQYHKDRVARGTVTQKGYLTRKDGSKAPANRVRAGQRFKLLNTGEIFFIRHHSYDAETQTVRISPDQPQDNIQTLFAQRDRGMGSLS